MLFLAAMAGNEGMVEALVSLKAGLEAADKIKFTPLMAAAASGPGPLKPSCRYACTCTVWMRAVQSAVGTRQCVSLSAVQTAYCTAQSSAWIDTH